MSELICQKSGKECLYGNFCRPRQERPQENGHGPVAGLLSLSVQYDIPEELVQAQAGSYCSEQRLDDIQEAMITAETDKSKTQTEKQSIHDWGIGIMDGIISERQHHLTVPEQLTE